VFTMKFFSVKFLPGETAVDVEPGSTVMEAAEKAASTLTTFAVEKESVVAAGVQVTNGEDSADSTPSHPLEGGES